MSSNESATDIGQLVLRKQINFILALAGAFSRRLRAKGNALDDQRIILLKPRQITADLSAYGLLNVISGRLAARNRRHIIVTTVIITAVSIRQGYTALSTITSTAHALLFDAS